MADSAFKNTEFKAIERVVKSQKPDHYDDLHRIIYRKDHWNGGEGFVGPLKTSAINAAQSEAEARVNQILNDGVKSNFTPEDIISEVISRRTDGILSKEPQFVPALRRALPTGHEDEEENAATDQEQERIERMNAGLTEWWYERGFHDTLKDLAKAVSSFRRANLRIFIPPGQLTEIKTTGEDGQEISVSGIQADTPEEALRYIHVDVVLPGEGVVYTDGQTMQKAGIVRFEKDKDPLRDEDVEERAELSYHDEDAALANRDDSAADKPFTVYQRVEKKGGGGDEYHFDMRGHLFLIEAAEREGLVDTHMRQQQKALNTASTEMRVVNDEEGFPKRVISNAMPPARVEKRRNPDTGEVEEHLVAEPFQWTPGMTMWLRGEEVHETDPSDYGGQGEPVVRDIKSPQATTLDAGKPENYRVEMDIRRQAILRMAKQLFVEITDDATASGESRVQALFDYLQDARTFKSVIEKAARDTLEAVWYLACHLSGNPGQDQDLKVNFDCRINVPFLPSALIEALLKLLEKGIWSRETLMTHVGIDDIEAEKELIADSRQYKIELRKNEAEAVGKWKDNGMSLPAAIMHVTGVDEAKARELGSRSDFEELFNEEEGEPQSEPPSNNGQTEPEGAPAA